MVRYLKSGALSEDAIHRMVMSWVNHQPNLSKYILHFPSEGKRTKTFGRRMKEYGMRRGVADLLITLQRRGYGAMWLELKSAEGLLSKEQKMFLDDMKEQGYHTASAHSFDEAIAEIEWYIDDPKGFFFDKSS